MARLIGFRWILYTTISVAWAFSEQASAGEPLRLAVYFAPPFVDLDNQKVPGFGVEVVREVFDAMGQEASFEDFPWDRGWRMVSDGERDGIFTTLRSSDREQICSFPDEPLKVERWVMFIRTADSGKLKFSSFDDLVGHAVAVHVPVSGVLEQPTVSPELWKFLREHHNMVGTRGGASSLRMLAAGHVDYAVANLSTGMWEIAAKRLSGKIEPLLSRNVIEAGEYVCFSKARVPAPLVASFSRALKQFKQTEAFRAIYRKYFP